ncbi:MAG: hypothetical protein ABI647_20840 [Gemmatimonadota bacterium]
MKTSRGIGKGRRDVHNISRDICNVSRDVRKISRDVGEACADRARAGVELEKTHCDVVHGWRDIVKTPADKDIKRFDK